MSIAPLRASELAEVAALHRVAFVGHAHAALGDAYARRLFDRARRSPSGVALVARRDGQVAGYALGVDMAHLDALQRGLRPWAALGVLSHPWIVIHPHVRAKLTAVAGRLLSRRSEASLAPRGLAVPVMGLLAIGVAPWCRRRGIGGQVLRAFERASSAYGASSAVLSVYARNEAARSLYAAEGWTVPEDTPRGAEALYYTRSLTGLT